MVFSHEHSKISSPSTLINQALNQNIAVIELKKKIKSLEISAETVKVLPDPELETEGLFSSKGNKGEFSLKQPIKLGGKTEKTSSVILTQVAQAKAQLLQEKENIVIETMKLLHRLRQIGTEVKQIKESVDSFMSIQYQYKKLPRLNPEQSISLDTIKMIQSKLLIHKAIILSEAAANFIRLKKSSWM